MQDVCQLDQLVPLQEEASNEGKEIYDLLQWLTDDLMAYEIDDLRTHS